MRPIFLFISFVSVVFSAIAQPAWQQQVDTRIEVTLNDRKNLLLATEEFTYTNNSPDTLHYIYVHLWPNAYKNDHTPFARQMDINKDTRFYYSKPADRGYIDSLQFSIDDKPVDYYSTDNAPDIARIDLPDPLLPHHSMKVTTPFRVKIPLVFSRLGHSGQAYYISQWFPKPAVYDAKGWHPISFLDQGEFYSEYGSYDVSITLPANYVVMATGNCMDDNENTWLDELARKPLPTMKYGKKTPRTADSAIASSTKMKTLHFHEDHVHDFAWFADKRWIVRKDTVYSPGNHKLVTVYAAFLPSYREQWQHATGYLKETVRHYGKWVGPYQFSTMKAVLGDMHAGGGMEYPTVTIIDRSASSMLQTTIVHEAGHNWFYSMLGSNERDHAWMDEGINTFYEQKTDADLDTAAHKKHKRGLDETLVLDARIAQHEDQPIDLTSASFDKVNYGTDVYYKTALYLHWLEAWMTPDSFEAGMHEYYNNWHFHHPQPADFRVAMEHHSTQSLSWFFDTLMNTGGGTDFYIRKAHSVANGATLVTIRNKGLRGPAAIDVISHDRVLRTVWTSPFTGATTVAFPGSDWDKLQIADVVPDARPQNDLYRRRALFHHFGLQFKAFGGLNRDKKDKLFVSPAFGYNEYDGFMAGLLLHDLTLPENRFRFALAPLYSFQQQSLAGAGSVGYLWYPTGFIHDILLQADGRYFHYQQADQPATLLHDGQHFAAGYTKVAPSLSFDFTHSPLSSVSQRLLIKGYYITEDRIDSGLVPMTGYSATSMTQQTKLYAKIDFTHKNSRSYNPLLYDLNAQAGADFMKMSAEGDIAINYNRPRKYLFVRGYVGKFIAFTNTAEVNTRYGLAATCSGVNDYLYDGTFIGRTANNDFAAQQVSIQEGGFTVPTFNNAAHSDNWLAAVNLKTDLPIKLPLRLFLDLGLIPNATPSFTNSSSSTLLYEGGVEIPLISSVVCVYVPLFMSSDFQNYITNTWGHKNLFAHSISFRIDLQNVNWLRAPETVMKFESGN